MLFPLLLAAAQVASGGQPVRTAPPPLPPGIAYDTNPPGQPHTLFLNFDGATLTKGNCSNALTGCTFLMNTAPTTTYNWPVYTNNVRKPLIIQQVKAYYQAYNIEVVSTRPAQGPYSMVMVGEGTQGTGTMQGALGVGPLDCGNFNESDITFAFTEFSNGMTTAQAVHDIASTIAQESAHAFGLGHTDATHDLMYPVLNGIETGFLNQNMHICDYGPGFPSTCGHDSDCTGTGMQNSHQFMLQALGANPNQGPDTVPPNISFITPHDGDSVPSGFHIEFNATDDRSIDSVTLYLDNGQIGGVGVAPYAFDVPGGLIPAGAHKIKGLARDPAGNQTFSAEITVTVKALGETPGDLGSPCMNDVDCPGGLCATNNANGSNFCTHTCDPMNSTCPMGFDCIGASGSNVCAPVTKSGGCGCEVGAARHAGDRLAAFLLLGVAVLPFATCFLQRRRFRKR